MNERIRELAEQNGFIHNWQPPGEQYEKLQTLEKFAELIVRECVSISEQHNRNYYKSHGQIIAGKIKEHFGVEL